MERWALFFLVTIISFSLFPQSIPPPPLPGTGGPCELSPSRAATLLFPYFEVDPYGAEPYHFRNTLISITNTGPESTVAHTTIWNVDGVPIYAFNLYLTGYDVATLSMKDILEYGIIFANGCTFDGEEIVDGWIDCDGDGQYFNQDPDDNAYWAGHPYQEEYRYLLQGACNGNCDTACRMTIPEEDLTRIQYMLSECSYDFPTRNYVGYMTVDQATTCVGGYPGGMYSTLPLPTGMLAYYKPLIDISQSATFDPSQALTPIGYSNTLMGDYFLIHPNSYESYGMTAVHIEALGMGSENGGSAIPEIVQGYYGILKDDSDWEQVPLASFYGKYTVWGGMTCRDRREPLPLQWGMRFLNSNELEADTWILFWRSHNWIGGPWTFDDTQYPECHSTMFDYLGTLEFKLPDPSVEFWDEEANSVTSSIVLSQSGNRTPPVPVGHEVPVMTGRYLLVNLLNSPFEEGWASFDFATDASELLLAPYSTYSSFDQSWVEILISAQGNASVGQSGIVLTNNCTLRPGGNGKILIHPND